MAATSLGQSFQWVCFAAMILGVAAIVCSTYVGICTVTQYKVAFLANSMLHDRAHNYTQPMIDYSSTGAASSLSSWIRMDGGKVANGVCEYGGEAYNNIYNKCVYNYTGNWPTSTTSQALTSKVSLRTQDQCASYNAANQIGGMDPCVFDNSKQRCVPNIATLPTQDALTPGLLYLGNLVNQVCGVPGQHPTDCTNEQVNNFCGQYWAIYCKLSQPGDCPVRGTSLSNSAASTPSTGKCPCPCRAVSHGSGKYSCEFWDRNSTTTSSWWDQINANSGTCCMADWEHGRVCVSTF